MNGLKGAILARWREAAELGDAEAQYNLSMAYANGVGVPQDSAEAVKWWRKAAYQGVADAQFNLGVMYHKGDGVQQDDVAAVRWFREAAMSGARQTEQGHAGAKRALQKLRR